MEPEEDLFVMIAYYSAISSEDVWGYNVFRSVPEPVLAEYYRIVAPEPEEGVLDPPPLHRHEPPPDPEEGMPPPIREMYVLYDPRTPPDGPKPQICPTCEDPRDDCEWTPNPFWREMGNGGEGEIVYVWLCSECYGDLCEEI